MLELRIHGYGGQGVVTLAHLLAQAGMRSGRQAQALPSFGVERRGAPVKAVVRISEEPIWVFSQSLHPDVVVLTEKNLLPMAEGTNAKIVLCDTPGNIPLFGATCASIGISEAVMAETLRERWDNEDNVRSATAAYNEVTK